jgi:hypothetical protein
MVPIRFFSNSQHASTLTECNPALFPFPPAKGRRVAASFDGGAITSDASVLLLLQTGRAV